jgi:thioesterase domain-containing protein
MGTCFGNLVALEMARQLYSQGESASLIILDSGYAGWPASALELSRKSATHFIDRLIYHWERRQVTGALLRYTLVHLKKLRQGLSYVSSSSHVRRLQRVRNANDKARMKYRAQVYPGAITLFRSSEFHGRKDKDWHLRWSELASGGFKYYVVPGTHLTMLHEPEVRILADKLRECLAEISGQESHADTPWAHTTAVRGTLTHVAVT